MNRNLLWNRYWVDTTLLLFPKHRKPDFEPPPLVDSGFPNQEQTRYDYAHRLTRFHFTMLSRDTVKLFHVLGEQLYVSQELAVMDWQKTLPKPPKPPPRELRTGTLPKELLGSVFAVYRDRNRDYLVTDKGTVYSVTPEGKDKVAIQPVWQDPKRWVFGVYSDKDGAVYGFGYDGPLHDRNRFYFRLDAKPVAVRYRFAAKLTNDLGDDSLREAFECGRALWKAQQKNEKK